MTALGELIYLHGRIGHLGLNVGCECGWKPEVQDLTAYRAHAEHLADVFRAWRFQRPVITKADERIQQEIRQRGQQIRARRRPSLSFLASLRRQP